MDALKGLAVRCFRVATVKALVWASRQRCPTGMEAGGTPAVRPARRGRYEGEKIFFKYFYPCDYGCHRGCAKMRA
jgi:hypothetical protein